MNTRKTPPVFRRRFKRAVRKWRAARNRRSRRKALRKIRGYLHHDVLRLLGPT